MRDPDEEKWQKVKWHAWRVFAIIYFIYKLICVQHTARTEVWSRPAAMLLLAWFMLGWITSETECTVDVGIEGICSLIMARLLICGELLSSFTQGIDERLPYLLRENGTMNSPWIHHGGCLLQLWFVKHLPCITNTFLPPYHCTTHFN